MMSNKFNSFLLAAGLFAMVQQAVAQGTAFTYQGQLQYNSRPASGLYDFQFSLSTAANGGSEIGGTITNLGLAVTNGLFAAQLDFGAVFGGNPTWLAIGVRTNGTGTYFGLQPLQPLSPTPYAITAGTVTGVVPASQVSGTIPLGQLPTGVALLNGGNSLSGNQTVSGGSVGIGTTTPAAALEVNGTALVDGQSTFYGGIRLNNASGFSQSALGQFSIDAPSIPGGRFTVLTTGSVGIGTSTPSTALQVNGTVTAKAFMGDGSGLTNLNFNNQNYTSTNTSTRLLFPFVSNQPGFDTGIFIANTSADPFGTAATNGTATIYFYGDSAPVPNKITIPNIAAGSSYSSIMSVLAPGFQGYLIVVCNFPLAHGFGYFHTGNDSTGTLTPALVLPPQRSIALPESLGQ